MDNGHKAGLLLLAGGALFLLGIHVAEALYPGYSVSGNKISDLGTGPAAPSLIFNSSVFLFGLLGALAALLLRRDAPDRKLACALAFSGIGAMGVGVFPSSVGAPHTISAFLAFFFGALVAVLSYPRAGKPLGYLAGALGITSLAALALFAADIYLGLGAGGMERMVLYPVLTWTVALGGLLAGRSGDAPEERGTRRARDDENIPPRQE